MKRRGFLAALAAALPAGVAPTDVTDALRQALAAGSPFRLPAGRLRIDGMVEVPAAHPLPGLGRENA